MDKENKMTVLKLKNAQPEDSVEFWLEEFNSIIKLKCRKEIKGELYIYVVAEISAAGLYRCANLSPDLGIKLEEDSTKRISLIPITY